ncbi:MAG: ABC transporter permease subunit [Arthrobacter sp.]|nr:ABC transporter permease subunit [Arthrobacter sp.]
MATLIASSVDRFQSRIRAKRKPERFLSGPRRLTLGVIGITALLLLWELLTVSKVVDPYLASSPTRILLRSVVVVQDGTLGKAALSSAILFLSGMLISIGTGIVIGVFLGWFKSAMALFDPLVSLLYAAPRIAFIPLLIVWIGAGIQTQIVMVVLNAVFPIIVSTMAGVANYDRQLASVSRSFGASNFQLLRTIALPGAVPFLLSGLRQGMMAGLLGTVVAEYFIGITGIGGMIFNAGLVLDSTTAFVGALSFSLAAIALSGALNLINRHIERWKA